jgi:hypothetical protein
LLEITILPSQCHINTKPHNALKTNRLIEINAIYSSCKFENSAIILKKYVTFAPKIRNKHVSFVTDNNAYLGTASTGSGKKAPSFGLIKTQK